ncbi:multidrug transporter [Defluviimonas sp. 20V17]|uniref:EmrB/QacA family drug resistance transporter n=1 Tax=Allgaiera indica TaxID=765699 RepID=A0AAN4UU89_9RHOB|nr:DHA2 family efflux MFS transporter permease subunit [Allgaiera indica]KDB04786.1 multidrug transporter [Defluviimonas sp. 20V17]GHE05113.1 EmrB/QacA family drug resistance transporter [Allgaiera indica]SDX66483.1 MFS transporter, DHA2 family, multidrug resistance protein [Allgaiera indica]
MTSAAGPSDATTAPAAGGGGFRVTIVIAVVLSAILEVLDSTIVNVALPDIQAAFGATNDQITWVLTSYIVASVVVMPLTGFLSKRIGRRRLILTAITGFALFSMLCGLSWSLGTMVLFRLGQGLFGAFLIPLSQSILFDSFPREKRGQAMAMFGLGIVVVPVTGPTLGALLTETFSWRMVFFVNLPMAILALLLIAGELPPDKPEKIRTDWTGLALMALAIGTLQFVMDQGGTLDWLSSRVIQVALIASAVAALFFMVHGLERGERNIVNLKLFADRNFSAACLVIAGFVVTMFGTIALQPLFVQNLLGYSVLDAGYMFIPRGLAEGFSMVITGAVLSNKIDGRLLAAVGLVLTGAGNLMLGAVNLNAGFWQVTWPGAVSGLGVGLVFVPLSTLAFERISSEHQDEASGLYNVTRQLGSSVGIAAVGALLTHAVSVNSARLTEHVTPYAAAVQSYLHPLGLSPDTAQGAAVLSAEVARQAALLSFTQVFTATGWLAFALLPILLIMTRSQGHGGAPMAH